MAVADKSEATGQDCQMAMVPWTPRNPLALSPVHHAIAEAALLRPSRTETAPARSSMMGARK